MKPGDVIEFAIWVDGRETPEMLAQFKADIQSAVNKCADRNRMIVSPPTLLEKRPGEDRVPPVPDHIQGPNVRLIVAEAVVVAERRIVAHSFLADLEPEDLERLRKITRRVHHGLNPDGTKRTLTDAEVDRTIEEYGPEAALDVIRKTYRSGDATH